MLQGMGSLHRQHSESPSAVTGGIGSVALKGSGESWVGLFLQYCELQWVLFTAVQRWIFSVILDMKLTVPVDFHPVLSLSLTFAVWLPVCFLLGCLESLWKFLEAFWTFFRVKKWESCAYASDCVWYGIHWVDWDPDAQTHRSGSTMGLCVSQQVDVLGHMMGKGPQC